MDSQTFDSKIRYHFLIFISCLLIVGCSEPFEYSPFDTDVSSRGYNLSNAEVISSISKKDTLKFAFISDPHNNYDELYEAIRRINKYDDLQFVVCCGDVTTFGLAWEYKKYCDLINNSSLPVITVIGNHDYVSNGSIIYKRLFGPTNLSFVCGKYKFIAFDDVIWENNNKCPDFEWLSGELENNATYHILMAHLPPWDSQLDSTYNQIFRQTVNRKNTILCLHGHQHAFLETEYNGIHTLVANCIKNKEFDIIELTGDTASIKQILY